MASLVSGSRFKTLPVTKRCSIKAFVEENSLAFKKGRGFYQLSKPEVVQVYKEVVVRRKKDGAFLTGEKVRELLGVPKTSKKYQLDLAEISDFDVFVQSTSVNRVLLPGTEFLYEVEGSEEEGDATGGSADVKGTAGGDGDKGDGDGEGEGGTGRKLRGRAAKRSATSDEPKPKRKAPAKRGAAATEPAKKEEPEATTGAAGKGRARGKRAAKKEKEEEEEEKPEPSPTKKPKVDEAGAAAEAVAPPSGVPGGPVEIVFSFDTTGSMYPCLTQVRRKVSSTIKRLQKEIPGIRVAIIAHGDYCDASYSYVTSILDFSTDEKELCDFVEKVGSTGGGDWEECYELVLYETRTKLSWTPGTQRSLVMIGDATPHNTSYSLNTLKLDWKKEAKALQDELGVRIYSVQALNNPMSSSFYRSLADLSSGYHLHLDQFASIVDFLMAICFKEQSMDKLQAYEDEVRGRGTGLNRSLHSLFDTLAGRTTTYAGGTDTGGLVSVDPARFQVLDVDERGDIRSFVQRNGLIFKPGRGFYEFTKPEKVSDKKEVVLVDKVSGDMFTGPEACRQIGAGGSGKIRPTSLEKWRVFVQSTSYNRVLMPNTGFLYEVDPEH